MTTPINQLSNETNETNENKDMMNDDCNSQIVNEILEEINNQPSHINNEQDDQYVSPSIHEHENNEMLNRQMDNINRNVDINVQEKTRPIVNVELKQNIKDKLIEKLKDPLSVILVVFVLNSPIISSIFVKYLPKLFSSGVNKSIQWLSILLKSIIAGILFYTIKMFL